MILQKIYDESVEDDIKSLFEAWPEISYKIRVKPIEVGDDTINVVYIETNDEDFNKSVGVFESKEEAMGAFRSFAYELGFEDYPINIAFLHAGFDGDKLFLFLKAKNDDNIKQFDQLSVEKLTKELPNYQRVVIYQSAVLTYLKDIYPAIDNIAYVIPHKLSSIGCQTPELSDLAKIYGVSLNTKEDEIRFIEKLLQDPKGLCKDKELPPIDIPL